MVRSRRLPSSGIYAPVKNDGYGQEQIQSKLTPPQPKERSTGLGASAAHFTPIDALIGGEKGAGGDRHHRSEPKKGAISCPKKAEHGNVMAGKASAAKEDSTKPKAVAAESLLVNAIGALSIGGKQTCVDPTPQYRRMTSPNSTMNSGGGPPSSHPPTMVHPQSMGVPLSAQPQHQQMVGSAYTMGVESGYGYPYTTASYPMTAQPQLHYPTAPNYSQPPNMGNSSLQQDGYGYGYPGYVQQASPDLVAPQSNYQFDYNPYYQMGGGSYTTPSQPGNVAPNSQMASYGQCGYGPYPIGTGYHQ